MVDHYLDCNATVAMRKEVQLAVLPYWGVPLNPSSVHAAGREARALVESARSRVLEVLDAQGAELVFTSSGTEANNQVISCCGRPSILVSAVEHISVLNQSQVSQSVAVDQDGIVDLELLEQHLKTRDQGSVLISVMLANNETGVIQPLAQVVKLARQYGAWVHTDAVQALGKIPVSFTKLGVDFMTVSGHKIGAGTGAAALIMRKGLDVQALIAGGGQEKRRRAGTENTLAIHAFGVAASLAAQELEKYAKHVTVLRDRVEEVIEVVASNDCVVARCKNRLPNTTLIVMPGVSNQTQLIQFDLEGIAVSSGAACSSGKVATSHVLQAMGIADEIAQSAVRISIGRDTIEENVEKFVAVWQQLYARSHQHAA
jgi:cysteine desulfurase